MKKFSQAFPGTGEGTLQAIEHQEKNKMAHTIAFMEGQTLYEMYARKLREEQKMEIKLWSSLTPTAKGFWQELAQDFLKVAQ
jgi:hypothetical protein